VAYQKCQVEQCSDAATEMGIALRQITSDGIVTPEELRELRAMSRSLVALGRILERVALGVRLVSQILRLGLDRAPEERWVRHMRQVQALELTDPLPELELDPRRAA
jgi:hypothetical protein